jgi:hypothetical protein
MATPRALRSNTVSSRNSLKWLTLLVFLAGAYNLVWGVLAMTMPERMLAWYAIATAQPLEFWQCIGMLVGVYGFAYVLASRNLHALWPIVLVGLLGKLLGPIGTFLALSSGRLPTQFLWLNVSNDFIWIPGFIWALVYVRRSVNPTTADRHAAELTLYQRVLGAKYERLSPRLRRFHAARQEIRVEGAFSVARGASRLGNWLTDRSGFPRTAAELPVLLRVSPSPTGEIWHRIFGAHTIDSWQGQRAGLFVERFGPLSMYLEADVDDGALVVRDLRTTFMGFPLPPPLSPQVDAWGRDDGEQIAVRIRITNPLLGELVAYSGKIRIVDGSTA